MKRLTYGIKHKNENGVALILAMMLMVALSLLTVNSFEMLIGSIRISRNHKDDLQAFYAAEAGIEDTVSQLRISGPPSFDSFSGSLAEYQYEVDFFEDGFSDKPSPMLNEFDFESVGTAGNFTRTLRARIKIVATPEYPNPVNYSVVIKSIWGEKEM